LQRKLKCREICPLLQITGTQNITLEGAMQTGDRLAALRAAGKVDAKNVHAKNRKSTGRPSATRA
jgi:hypothetical protein